MNVEYDTLEVNLDEETEFKMVENFVKTFTLQSQSIFTDNITNGQDFRSAMYEAWRNEEIIKALQLMIAQKEKLPSKLTDFDGLKTEETSNQTELTQEEKDYNSWSEASYSEGGMASGS